MPDADIEVEKGGPLVGWKEIDRWQGKGIKTPGGNLIEIEVSKDSLPKDIEDPDKLETTAIEAVSFAYDYVFGTLGKDFKYLDKKVVIDLTGGYRPRFQGILMKLGSDTLTDFSSDKDTYRQDRAQSLVIHELIHNLTDNEDFPMFAELIYILEKGHTQRLDEIEGIISEGDLEKQHLQGIDGISSMLGIDRKDFFKKLKDYDVNKMKKVFKDNLTDYCKSEYD